MKNLNCIDEEKAEGHSVSESVTNLNMSTKDTQVNNNNKSRTLSVMSSHKSRVTSVSGPKDLLSIERE